ncbi:MAG: MraY family glycosyltransferase [Pseudomonadales bacterium]|nr:MraY family glycosyltransferase [Pseudomonadales bacterium]
MIGFLSLLNLIATPINLVDHPDGERKRHTGTIPLMGGAAIFMTLLIVLILTPRDTNAIVYHENFWPAVGILLAVLVVTHAVDDIRGISALMRLTLDVGTPVMLCTIALLKLDTLGWLFGDSETTMERWAIPMTVFSFVAASNAFNMTDGIDSLCTGLGIICFSTIIAPLLGNGNPESQGLVELCKLVIFALLPMYLANLGLLGDRLKSFLGDSGARLIGFMAAIALIYYANKNYIHPVMAHFSLAVLVCDCLILMGGRAFDRRSHLSTDR